MKRIPLKIKINYGLILITTMAVSALLSFKSVSIGNLNERERLIEETKTIQQDVSHINDTIFAIDSQIRYKDSIDAIHNTYSAIATK